MARFDRTAAAFCSSVLFQTGRIVAGLPEVAAACTKRGAELLIDAYHHLNVLPFDLRTMIKWFGTHGYSTDIPAVRAIHPGLMTLPQWLAKTPIQ